MNAIQQNELPTGSAIPLLKDLGTKVVKVLYDVDWNATSVSAWDVKNLTKYKKAGLRHLLTGMGGGPGRHMRKAKYLNKVDAKVIKTLIPYR